MILQYIDDPLILLAHTANEMCRDNGDFFAHHEQ